jgi:hypothetical protein
VLRTDDTVFATKSPAFIWCCYKSVGVEKYMRDVGGVLKREKDKKSFEK